ncbi:MAG: hypothetical protein K1X57_13765 [Gemmataceae bacterium]|nr:hypothetical protein [Gemmataceae bacterium]
MAIVVGPLASANTAVMAKITTLNQRMLLIDRQPGTFQLVEMTDDVVQLDTHHR